MDARAEGQEDAISRDEAAHVALLSRLDLSEEELGAYARMLNHILAHFEKLNELDTQDVPPTSHPAPVANVFREDEPRPSLPVELALANAPQAEGGCFVAPRVIQEA